MNQKRIILLLAGLFLFVGLVVGYANRPLLKSTSSTLLTRMHRVNYAPFPDMPDAQLTDAQRALLAIAELEYDKRPTSYDQAVLTYTDGNKEAWCANFTSWLMKQVGQPYSNPNSESWRIPGVLTLQGYYQAENRFQDAGSYTPQTGDVAFYIGKHGPFGLMNRQHVAIVLSSDGKTMTTLGGNEEGHMLIKTQSIYAGDHNLVGFGVLPKN